jgi:hypothetical protein
MKFETGKAYKIYIKNVGRIKIHVLAIVDDDQIVYKYYSLNRQQWVYRVESNYMINYNIELNKASRAS